MPVDIRAIAHVGIRVHDLARSVAFYEHLGFHKTVGPIGPAVGNAIYTYLSPRLYMAYGIGLFEDVRTLRLRYSVASRWSLQAESGDAQSGMIQYRGER